MSRPWILLCPSSRGIGHALTRHLLQHTHPSIPILATARSENLSQVKDGILKGLAGIPAAVASDRLHIVRVDVTSESTVQRAAEQAASLFPRSSHHLHLAFALPGVLYVEKRFSAIDHGRALETFKVNVLGPMMLMKWFGDFLPRKNTVFLREGPEKDGRAIMRKEDEVDKDPPSTAAGAAGGYGGEGDPVGGSGISTGKDKDMNSENTSSSGGGDGILKLPSHATWVTMSARVGSVSDNRLGGWYSYRSSKAAVNSLTKSLDLEIKSKSAGKAMAVSYHPGTVKTGLSREFWDSVANDGLFDLEDAVEKMARVVTGLRRGQRGKCWDWKGQEVAP